MIEIITGARCGNYTIKDAVQEKIRIIPKSLYLIKNYGY